ncbi:MAG: hypothetical protein ACOCV2_07250 [Persicimonas sp.]
MSDEHAEPDTDAAPEESGKGHVWILVDHSAHRAAFESVADRLAERDVEAQIVTITEVIGTVARDALAGGAERLLRGLRVAVQGRPGDEDLLGAVRRARPDLLAVTNPRYGRALGLLESLTGITSLQVGILPDYDLSSDWTNSSLQAFVVPTDEQRGRLVESGFLAERVFVSPPSIGPGFARSIERAEVREEFGFGSEPVVLVRAGQFSPQILEKIVFQATLVDDEDVRFVFHHEGDEARAAALRRAADQYGLSAAMFGKVVDLERYVAASDLVVCATADPQVPGILAQGQPLVLLGADEPGAAQAEFLAEQGAARQVVDVLRLGSELERALDGERLDEATRAAGELGARDGNERLADVLCEILDHADAWLGAGGARDEEPSDAEAPEDDRVGAPEEEASVEGPFESIGTGKGAGSGESAATGDKKRSPRTAGGTLTAAEAKDQLAELILKERELERRLAECEKQQDRWRSRLELAREWSEDDLAEEASEVLRDYLDQGESVEAELADIRRQKEKLKRAVGRGGSSQRRKALPSGEDDGGRDAKPDGETERRFRDMELDRDLDDLKDRIDRELGD